MCFLIDSTRKMHNTVWVFDSLYAVLNTSYKNHFNFTVKEKERLFRERENISSNAAGQSNSDPNSNPARSGGMGAGLSRSREVKSVA